MRNRQPTRRHRPSARHVGRQWSCQRALRCARRLTPSRGFCPAAPDRTGHRPGSPWAQRAPPLIVHSAGRPRLCECRTRTWRRVAGLPHAAGSGRPAPDEYLRRDGMIGMREGHARPVETDLAEQPTVYSPTSTRARSGVPGPRATPGAGVGSGCVPSRRHPGPTLALDDSGGGRQTGYPRQPAPAACALRRWDTADPPALLQKHRIRGPRPAGRTEGRNGRSLTRATSPLAHMSSEVHNRGNGRFQPGFFSMDLW